MSGTDNQQVILNPIYNPRRALEHLQTIQDITPVRLFAILFPLWDIEITATQEESRPYELMERYVERGIDEGGFHTIEEFVGFLGLQLEIVQKILSFLETLGHVTRTGTSWDLTPLGRRSVREGKKYVAQEKRIRLYFDAYTSKPLRKEHYNRKTVHVFSPEEAATITHSKTWGYRFHLIMATREWQSASLRELEARINKAEYNVPPEMRSIQVLAVRPAYLPMYIIETAKNTHESRPQYLVYTGIRERRDPYFEHIIHQNATVYAALQGERVLAQRDLWGTWLQEKGITGIPLELPDGTWQIALPASAFEGLQAKFATTRVGDYELRDGYFIQIWCQEKALRRKAALDRTLRLVKNQQRYIKWSALQEHLSLLATQLQISGLRIEDVQQRAIDTNMKELMTVLNDLQRASTSTQRAGL